MRIQIIDQEKIFANHVFDKNLNPEYINNYKNWMQEGKEPNKNGATYLKRHIIKEDLHILN